MLFCHGHVVLLHCCVWINIVLLYYVCLCVCVHPVQKFSDNFLPDVVTKLSCAQGINLNMHNIICMVKEQGYV